MAARMIVISHRDGRRVAVTPHDFTHAKVGPEGETFEAQGFKVESWEGGEPFEEPKKSKPSGG